MRKVIETKDSKLTIVSNNHWREILYGYSLPDSQRKEFDFLEGEEFDNASFVKYKNQYHYLGDFMSAGLSCGKPVFPGWQGYESDSFFSGHVIRFSEDGEGVQIGFYYC